MDGSGHVVVRITVRFNCGTVSSAAPQRHLLTSMRRRSSRAQGCNPQRWSVRSGLGIVCSSCAVCGAAVPGTIAASEAFLATRWGWARRCRRSHSSRTHSSAAGGPKAPVSAVRSLLEAAQSPAPAGTAGRCPRCGAGSAVGSLLWLGVQWSDYASTPSTGSTLPQVPQEQAGAPRPAPDHRAACGRAGRLPSAVPCGTRTCGSHESANGRAPVAHGAKQQTRTNKQTDTKGHCTTSPLLTPGATAFARRWPMPLRRRTGRMSATSSRLI